MPGRRVAAVAPVEDRACPTSSRTPRVGRRIIGSARTGGGPPRAVSVAVPSGQALPENVPVSRELRLPADDWDLTPVVCGRSTSWMENAVLDVSGQTS